MTYTTISIKMKMWSRVCMFSFQKRPGNHPTAKGRNPRFMMAGCIKTHRHPALLITLICILFVWSHLHTAGPQAAPTKDHVCFQF